MTTIIELDHDSARAVLILVKVAAKSEPEDSQYWGLIVRQIEQCLEAQANGKFYQCSACTDWTERDGGNHPILA